MSIRMETAAETAVRPALPRVNLLPPEIGERRRFRRMQLLSGGAACVALALVGGGYVVTAGSVTDARTALDATRARQHAAEQRVHAYDYVVQTNDLVDQRHQLLATALTGEVHWSQYLNNFSESTPSGVWLTSLTVTPPQTDGSTPTAPESLSSGSTSGAPTTESGAPSGAGTTGTTGTGAAATPIATISFEGEALRYDDVSLWLESLTTDTAYTDPFVTEVSEDKIGDNNSIKFIGTVTMTSAALVPNPAGN